MKVLVVDDDDVDREHIRRVLSRGDSSCTIVEAITVDQGLAKYRNQHYDVILLDYRMPQKDGIEMLMEIKSEYHEFSTAVVMMSTSEEEKLSLDCLKAGAQDFIIKADITASRLRRCILHAQTRFELEKKLLISYQKVKQLAEHDSLTGVTNRYLFDETLRLSLTNIKRSGGKLALLLIDLDNFKDVNDNYGHDIGDALLKNVVNRIRSCLRGNELFARLGGDEFGITLTNLKSEEDASLVATRILNILKKPFDIGEILVNSAASIGISIHPENGSTAEELFKHADIAMYRAKKLGKNQACFFNDEMQRQFSLRYNIENSLRDALREKNFLLCYQPIFSVSDKELVGFEALIRLPNSYEFRMPDEFIPVAESSKLIIDIGRWVVGEALQQLAKWNGKNNSSYTMAVNLSVVQLTDRTLVDFIESCLQENSLSPSSVMFELTETALFDDTKEKVDTLKCIDELGCKIALDDFGTGFSSVSHLGNFPISTVKIDKSLMPSRSANEKVQALFRGLVSMIHFLELDLVGEGVETQEDLDICEELSVHKIQGYFFCKALTHDDIEKKYFGGSEDSELK